MAGDLLEINELRVEIPVRRGTVHAVGGVSLAVRPGETLGVVGESGSGKTMVAMSVMRLLPPGARIAGGSIKILGTDVAALPDIAPQAAPNRLERSAAPSPTSRETCPPTINRPRTS